MSKEIFTRAEARSYLKVSLGTLVNWEKSNELVPKRIGRRCYYLKQDIYDKLGIEA